MSNNKIIWAGLAGAVAFFFLGWIIYGMLLSGFFEANSGTATGVQRPEEDMNFPAMIVANLAWGYLFAIIFGYYGNVRSAMGGLKAGALIGFLITLGFDLIMYSTTYIMTLNAVMVDVLASTVMLAIAGAIVGAVLGSGQKAVAA